MTVDTVTIHADHFEELLPLVAAIGYLAYRKKAWELLDTISEMTRGTPWEMNLRIMDRLITGWPINVATALAVVHVNTLPRNKTPDDCHALYRFVAKLVEVEDAKKVARLRKKLVAAI